MGTQVRSAYRQRYFLYRLHDTWKMPSAPYSPIQSKFQDRDLHTRVKGEPFFFLSIDTESINFDHHLRCGGWLNFEFSKSEKHSGWAIKLFTRS